MIKNVVVEVEPRTGTGKNECRRIRAGGSVPGILYGLDRPPFPVAVNPRRIKEVLSLESGKNTIFTLALAGQDKTRSAMIRELQRDPVSEDLIHVDFVRVDLARSVTVKVPVRLLGVPEGVKTEGGVLEFVLREIEVECLPADIPEHLDVDVSGLHLNQHVAVSVLTVPDKVEILDDPGAIICVVAAPREEEAPVAVEAPAEVAEPEVAKKGKEAAGPKEEVEPPKSK